MAVNPLTRREAISTTVYHRAKCRICGKMIDAGERCRYAGNANKPRFYHTKCWNRVVKQRG